MSSNYWSSTTNANNTNNAWHVNFNNGNVNNNNKTNSYYVRAVRSGKCELLSFASVYRAYLDCRKRKRGTVNAIRFEYDILENLTQLALDTQQGTYRPSRSVCFITTRPKLREIFAADFRDRIVHHLVVRELEAIWEKKFIHDSFASRKGKGTHEGVKRLQRFMLQATRSMKKPAWYLQLDIRSFFMSIDKEILFAILEKALANIEEGKRCALLYLLGRIIFHDCTTDYRFRGDPAILAQVPSHKSLFSNEPGKGLPIGNLTSQFLANVYLDGLDQFVKHTLKCRFYVRYVDDFVLVSESSAQLHAWRQEIESFLVSRLSLRLKEPGMIRRVSEGVDFLGYIVRPGYLLARRRVVNNLKAKIEGYRRSLVMDQKVSDSRYCRRHLMEPSMVAAMRQTISSYLGHFKHAHTFRLVNSLWAKHAWLSEYFILNDGRLHNRFRYGGVFRSLRAQTHFFRYRMSVPAVLLVKVGKFYELFGEDAWSLGAYLGLHLQEMRRGLDCMAGFPSRMRAYYAMNILNSGRDLAVLEEKGPGPFVAERYVHEIFRLGGYRA